MPRLTGTGIFSSLCIMVAVCTKIPDCNVVLNGYMSGLEIRSPNFPFDYRDSLDCRYQIYFRNGGAIRRVCFRFRRFDLEEANDCRFDYLAIGGYRYCGRGHWSLTHDDQENPYSTVWSNDFCFDTYSSFTFDFHSDNSKQAKGFFAHVWSEPSLYDLINSDLDSSAPKAKDPVHRDFHATQIWNLTADQGKGEKQIVDGQMCPDGYFRCFNRRCLTPGSVCDDVNQCGDNSDEEYAHSRCTGSTSIRQKIFRSCDFEYGRCNFRMSSWTRTKSATPASHSGPRWDHTKGPSSGGWYIRTYFKEEIGSMRTMETAYLHFRNSSCLTFWYHLWGENVGRLQISFQRISSGPTDGFPVWQRDGNHGDTWLPGQLQLPVEYAGSRVSFKFSAIRGRAYESFIALDDIFFTDTPCNEAPEDLSCSFELDTCGWTQQKYVFTNSNWRRNRGPSNKTTTGPLGDRTSGAGYYMFVDGSWSSSYRSAMLVSPVVRTPDTSGRHCLRFWYHMYSSVGMGPSYLRVRTISQDGGLSTHTYYSRHGSTPRNKWHPARVEINKELPFQVVLEVQLGSKLSIDIAVDDVSLIPGPCKQEGDTTPPPGPCGDFEWQCPVGGCIPKEFVCDQDPDCHGGEDEETTMCTKITEPATPSPAPKASISGGPSWPAVGTVAIIIPLCIVLIMVAVYLLTRNSRSGTSPRRQNRPVTRSPDTWGIYSADVPAGSEMESDILQNIPPHLAEQINSSPPRYSLALGDPVATQDAIYTLPCSLPSYDQAMREGSTQAPGGATSHSTGRTGQSLPKDKPPSYSDSIMNTDGSTSI